MKRIGITGGIASGKSAVSSYLLTLGYPVIDADQIARQVVQAGSQGLVALQDIFGDSLIDSKGELKRAMLARLLFSDKQVQAQVNVILHPLIFAEIASAFEQYQQAGQALVFADIPLLYETDYQTSLDQVWVVYVDKTLQIERLMQRNHLDYADAKRRVEAQMPLAKKCVLADEVINNSGTLAQTQQQVDDLLLKHR